MRLNNATYLFAEGWFQKPTEESPECIHSSESFWTSFLAMHLLLATRNGEVRIQRSTVKKNKAGNDYDLILDNSDSLILKELKFKDIVVEGKVNDGLPYWAGLEERIKIPNIFDRLSPDLIIQGGSKENRTLHILEVKTIRSKLDNDQIETYGALKEFLREEFQIKRKVYRDVTLDFVISAGYPENGKPRRETLERLSKEDGFGVVSWETILDKIAEDPHSPLNALLPISQFEHWNALEPH